MVNSKVTLLIVLGLLLVGCRDREGELHQALGSQLAITQAAQQQAAAHWDRLILGDGADCSQGLPVPGYFTLTQSQADAYPVALVIRNELYVATGLLGESSRVWDEICAVSDPLVAPEVVDQGYKAAQQAAIPLQTALDAYAVWNP